MKTTSSWRPSRRARHAVGIASLSLVLGVSTPLLAVSSVSVSQVQSAVRASIASNRQPATTTPSFASLASGPTKFTGASLVDRCSPRLHVGLRTRPVPCYLGAANGPLWVLWGDSNAAAWIPALKVVAAAHQARLAVFVFPGCKSRFVDGSESGFLDKITVCRAWHAALPSAIQALHPSVVISAELADRFSGQQADVAAFASEWKFAFDSIVGPSSTATRVLLEPTPNKIAPNGVRRSIPACLAVANNAAILPCSGEIVSDVWNPGSYWTYLMAYRASATTANARLIPTSQLFCSTIVAPVRPCPAVVKTYSVFADEDHVTTAYMTYIATAVHQLFVQAGI
jgi:hypothetical protein